MKWDSLYYAFYCAKHTDRPLSCLLAEEWQTQIHQTAPYLRSTSWYSTFLYIFSLLIGIPAIVNNAKRQAATALSFHKIIGFCLFFLWVVLGVLQRFCNWF
jgi:hypothetical protein